ncbi:hypothetical protein KXQ82_00695 [Mucilaginibacter sp. HMF5004]|uniref:hypothetical protein n=1 Tax=Mucilaginibacter rivuli TaxID=2857527 RepID=UPI001C5ED00D|nr:hypothetical protein [Mucilaginibacter rivuli]MBW4888205.1 hypothetical protein [Mucilaginibacter rivuli]
MLVKKVLVYLIVISAAVLVYSLGMPTYTNDTYKQALDDRGMKAMTNHTFKDFEPYYYKKLDDLRTNRPQLMDISFGLLIASVTIYCFTLSTKIRKYHNFKAVKTFDKGSLIFVSNIVWLLLIPGVYWHYLFRSGRGDYPWFVDDISIPLGSKIPLIAIGWVLLNVFVIFFASKGKFKAHLFSVQPPGYSKGLLWDVFWGTLIFINTLILVFFIADGDHISIVVDLYLTYLLLSLRAGIIHAIKVRFVKEAELAAENQSDKNAGSAAQ